MPGLLAPSYYQTIRIAGLRCIPHELLEARYPQTKQRPDPNGKKEEKNAEDLAQEARETLNSIADGLKMAWQLQGYSRYSRNLKKEFEEKHSPRELQRYIYDANGRLFLPQSKILAAQEGQSDFENVSPEAKDVYDHVGFIFEEFETLLGLTLPQPLISIVNFNTNYLATGFNNAFFSPLNFGLPMTVFGGGDGILFQNFAHSFDVKAHEYGHFFLETSHPKKFPYRGQPGAVNEHIADVIGVSLAAKYFGWQAPYTTDQWRIGAEIMVAPDSSLRHMLFPGTAFDILGLAKDKQPDRMSQFKITGLDNGGVHINSGILNRLFALFAQKVGEPMYERPLKIWLKAIQTVRFEPDFFDFALQLKLAARIYGLEQEFMEAAKEVEVFDYRVHNGKLVSLKVADHLE